MDSFYAFSGTPHTTSLHRGRKADRQRTDHTLIHQWTSTSTEMAVGGP